MVPLKVGFIFRVEIDNSVENFHFERVLDLPFGKDHVIVD